ncbi:MAG: signal peptidase I [Nocardioides sp.]|nr:signal peptidase I [Nocardioides sp.]
MATQTERPARVLRETVLLLAIALVLALGVKTFLLQSFYIPSESMEPGLVRNDRILVEKPSYWLGGDPQRGDVVVFEDPGDWLQGIEVAEPRGIMARGLATIGLYPTGGHLVKRVIGVAGDVIVCCDEQGRLSVNGVYLDEDEFIVEQAQCDGPMAGCDWMAGPVPAGDVFVMGDNRDNSRDSSYHLTECKPRDTECDRAYVPTDLVVGKVFSLVWPVSNARMVTRPDVFADIPDTPPDDLVTTVTSRGGKTKP